MKKIICAILAAVLTLSIFASCNTGKKPGGESGSSEPVSTVTGPDTSDIEKGEILGGKFYLGMTKADMLKALEDENMKLIIDEEFPEYEYTSDGGAIIENGKISYQSDLFSFKIDSNGTLSAIYITTKDYQSAAGLTFGDSIETVKAIYGEGKIFDFDDVMGTYDYSYKFGDNYLILSCFETETSTWQISKTEVWF